MTPESPYPQRHRTRHEIPGHARFLTFSCFKRFPLLQTEATQDIFESALLQARKECRFELYAWVVMPNHVHLLLRPSLPEHPVASILNQIKQPVAKHILAEWRRLNAPVIPKLTTARGEVRFWQRGGGYDRNIFSKEEFMEKLTYIHLNPVKAGLSARPEGWKWSSAAAYAGDRVCDLQPDPLPPM
ncbi:MAG: transposase [Phycisphaerales bacterium JB050]